MSKIVSLTGSPIADVRKVDAEAVKALEEFLDMARAGEIVGFVAIAERADGTHPTLRAGPFKIEPMIGWLERLKSRLIGIAEG